MRQFLNTSGFNHHCEQNLRGQALTHSATKLLLCTRINLPNRVT